MGTDAGVTNTLIVLAADQASFYQFVKERQEAPGGTLVILDRRTGDRRHDGQTRPPGPPERRRGERRTSPPDAALALMSVLGFMILHRNGDRWGA
jgi:hypothetical protein